MSSSTMDWRSLTEAVALEDPKGQERLYEILQTSFRWILRRSLGTQAAEDRLHDVYVTTVEAIQAGRLRDPDRLPGFLKTVTFRKAIHGIRDNQAQRRSVPIEEARTMASQVDTPDRRLVQRQQQSLMMETLREMSDRDREVLTRFYLHEQTADQICEEMGLTQTQFRLLKSRAKARFGEKGRGGMKRVPRVNMTESEQEA